MILLVEMHGTLFIVINKVPTVIENVKIVISRPGKSYKVMQFYFYLVTLKI